MDPDTICEAYRFPDRDDAHLNQRLVAAGKLTYVVKACLADPAPAGECIMVLIDGDGWPPYQLVEAD